MGSNTIEIIERGQLELFVYPGTRWAHFDVYAWNDADRPGRPAGGEAQAMRAAFEGIARFAAGYVR